MKHFIVKVHYDAPIEKIDKVLQDHRAFLQQGYDSGMLLMSGPMNPREAGIAICRAPDQKVLESFFALDPYNLQGLVHYEFIEFNPVKYQAFIRDWVVQ